GGNQGQLRRAQLLIAPGGRRPTPPAAAGGAGRREPRGGPPAGGEGGRAQPGRRRRERGPGQRRAPEPRAARDGGRRSPPADDDEQQLIVWAGDAEVGSEDTMLSVAVGIARQGGVCERLHDDTTFGAPRPVVDCSFATPGAPRKVLVGVAGGERSAMVLAQLDGEDLADTAAVLGPFLDAVAWT